MVRERASVGPLFGIGGFTMRADRDVEPYHYQLESRGSARFGMIDVASEYPQFLLQPRRR